MKTTVQRLRQAERILEQRRDAAQRELARRKQTAYERIPALERLERQIAETGSAVVSAVLNAEGERKDTEAFLQLLEQQNIAAQTERARLLREHGFPDAYLQARHVCALCRDSGYIRGIRCGCFTQLLQTLAYQELNMDAPLEDSTFESFRLEYYPDAPDPVTGVNPRKMMENALILCREYAASFDAKSESLLFTGPTGLGKTHLSLAIARETIAKGHTVIYGSAQNLLGRLEREHFGRAREQSGSTEMALLACDLLILDDLGAEFSTSFTQSCIYNIVNTRLMTGQPVIINTNLNSVQLNEKYGERVTSRIIGNYIVLRFFGNDLRQIKK